MTGHGDQEGVGVTLCQLMQVSEIRLRIAMRGELGAVVRHNRLWHAAFSNREIQFARYLRDVSQF